MTRQVPQSHRRRRGNHHESPAVGEGKSGASPYLQDADPPRKRPSQLFLAASLWVLCIIWLVYSVIW